MTLDVAHLKNEFPEPWVYDTPHNDMYECGYCVGGAVVLHNIGLAPNEAEETTRFPCPESLAEVLRRYNPNLTDENARIYAENITIANDKGRFDDAWAFLADAMEYTEDNLNDL